MGKGKKPCEGCAGGVLAPLSMAVQRQVTVLCLCLVAVSGLQLTTGVPFHDWVSEFEILDGLSPSKSDLEPTSFLQYVIDPDTGIDYSQWSDLDARSLKEQGCDGSFDCSLYSEDENAENYQKDAEPFYRTATAAPTVRFPAGRIPRTARCHITCDYQVGFEFQVGTYSATEGMSLNDEPPSDFTSSTDGMHPDHATKAHAASHAASFLETGSETTGDDQSVIPVNNMGAPFHCHSQCEFKAPQFCNPVRRMVIGGAGYTPVEHECCELCEKTCAAKTIVDRYRVCYMGCRSFCPFVEA